MKKPRTRTHLISVANLATINVWSVGHQAILELIAADAYTLIVPASDVAAFREVTSPMFDVESEDDYLEDISPALEERFDGEPSRYGWYLQQFIKLSAAERLCGHSNVIIWDADTIPLKSIDFFPSGLPSFFAGVEHHPPYFAAIQRLLGLEKQSSCSFIAQCLPISANHGRRFFRWLEEKNNRRWFEEVISSIDFREPAGFSEYETVGNFVLSRFPKDLRWQDAEWLRNGWLLFSSPRAAVFGFWRRFWRIEYAFCSFERYQKPTFGLGLSARTVRDRLRIGSGILKSWLESGWSTAIDSRSRD